MEFSPRRASAPRKLYGKLYRRRLLSVILAVCGLLAGSWLEAQAPITQYGKKPKANKGPRAIGLVQIAAKGKKSRFIPIAIMIDGKFYDAGSYKASPVPMALDFDTVYEGFHSGVSQGLFTITQPGQLNHVWIAEGTWLPAGERVPEKSKKYSTPVIEDKDAPPVLHRRSTADSDSSSGAKAPDKDRDKDKAPDKDKDDDRPKLVRPPTSEPPSAQPAGGASTTPSADPGKAQNAPETAKSSAPATVPATAAASAPATDEQISDPNRPRLRRGKPESTEHREAYATFDPLSDVAPAAKADAKTTTGYAADTPQFTFVPAISDATGPDPRPYTYELKPAEEATYRNKMLELAATQLRAHAGAAAKDAPASKKPAKGKSTHNSAELAFDSVILHFFDLSNSNDLVLVLSAKTHPPANAPEGFEPQEITLIARTNLEGELKKLFFSQTDSHHLDVAPRMELVDAVDADGDGRGELLFRRTNDDGSSYAIYRVTADGLWPLFEGTP
ncbi:MAG TPA: hypothetical protein VKR59_17700 [Terriglobales bacterium]|nr:hypothetical protein [Terriglobales bacterium]